MGSSSSVAYYGMEVDEPGEIHNQNTYGGLRGFTVTALAHLFHCKAENANFHGFDMQFPGATLSHCESHHNGQWDKGETGNNVGHGVLMRRGGTVRHHKSYCQAEDGYQIGTAVQGNVAENDEFTLEHCEAYYCSEDMFDIKETGKKLTIRHFRGHGALDSAINYHPNVGSGLVEITDGRFSGTVQMLRVAQVESSIPAKFNTARNVFDASNRGWSDSSAPCFDWKASIDNADAYFVSMADVFIGGGTRGISDKHVVNIKGAGKVKLFNPTIHVPSTPNAGDVSAIGMYGTAAVEIYNACLTNYGGGTRGILEVDDNTRSIKIADSVMYVKDGDDNTVYVTVGSTTYTKADIEGANFGGEGNIVDGSVELTNLYIKSPNYMDEANNLLAPLYITPHMANHGLAVNAPMKDVMGLPFNHWSWMGGSENVSMGVGAYHAYSGRMLRAKNSHTLAK
ncbi:hypothetical protein [Vibrio phage vB_VmeM-Yong MS31]|nr:hypothetical protein [Vibrio phage vB_VmeM-Yong MS31]